MSGSREEERRKLADIINHWNANRLDLFEISRPTEDLEFHGVMRFYFQDRVAGNFATKCIRVSSTATTQDVIETLAEKFRPDMRMLSSPRYSLYEVHVSGEERQLDLDEKPLVVQLNWNKDDREGRFVLKNENDILPKKSQSNGPEKEKDGVIQNFKRTLSKKEKKKEKKREKEFARIPDGDEQTLSREDGENRLAAEVYKDMPETSFTRTISNPEVVMKRRRQQKLEKRMQEFMSSDGRPESGGTLRIYADSLKPNIPYKTILLSTRDTADFAVVEALEKYGLEKENPREYCIARQDDKSGKEVILDDTECPLQIFRDWPADRGALVFQLKKRPPDYQGRKGRKVDDKGPRGKDCSNSLPPEKLPYLVELSPGRGNHYAYYAYRHHEDGSDSRDKPKLYRLQHSITEVGSDCTEDGAIQLLGPGILPHHCNLMHTEGMVTVTPHGPDADTYVDGQRVTETTVLRSGSTLQFGSTHVFKFVDPMFDQGGKREPTAMMRGRLKSGSVPETTFDLHGDVHSGAALPTSKSSGKLEMERGMVKPMIRGEQQDSRSQDASADRTDLTLPASIEFKENLEDTFLSAIINYTNSSTVHFKLSPTYVLYMACRYVLSPVYRSDMSPSERTHKVITIINKMVSMMEGVIQKQKNIAGALAFWMANASELLNFIKQDRDLCRITLDAQDILAHLVQMAFKYLVHCLQADMNNYMPAFLDDPEEHNPQRPKIEDVLHTLTGAMSLLRRCRVNAALTIQLFSQLFHFINMWLFNKLVTDRESGLCCHYWGAILRQQLSHIEAWAEKQGLELAADCHLSRIVQATTLLTMDKYSTQDVQNIHNTCFKLNSLQLHALMTNYHCAPDEPYIPPELIDHVVAVAENTADELARSDGREVQLEEDPDLQLPFLLPEDGYSCDVVRSIPNGLQDFLEPLLQRGFCRLIPHPRSPGTWTVHFDTADCDSHFSSAENSEMPMRKEPEVVTVTLKKHNGMGLSIVAAKGAGQEKLGIYIKSVVKGGAADMDGRLAAGDQLLSVDGRSLVGLSQERAAELMTRTGSVVTLEVAKQGAIYHGLATLLNQPSPMMQRASDRGREKNGKMRPKSEGFELYNSSVQNGSPESPQSSWDSYPESKKMSSEDRLLKNRADHRSSPNVANQGQTPAGKAVYPGAPGAKITSVSTGNLCADEEPPPPHPEAYPIPTQTYPRDYFTIPASKSQDRVVGPGQAPSQQHWQPMEDRDRLPVVDNIHSNSMQRVNHSQEELYPPAGSLRLDERIPQHYQQDYQHRDLDYQRGPPGGGPDPWAPQQQVSSSLESSTSSQEHLNFSASSSSSSNKNQKTGPGRWKTPNTPHAVPSHSVQPPSRSDLPPPPPPPPSTYLDPYDPYEPQPDLPLPPPPAMTTVSAQQAADRKKREEQQRWYEKEKARLEEERERKRREQERKLGQIRAPVMPVQTHSNGGSMLPPHHQPSLASVASPQPYLPPQPQNQPPPPRPEKLTSLPRSAAPPPASTSNSAGTDTVIRDLLPQQQPRTIERRDLQYITISKEELSTSDSLSPDPWKRDAREKAEKQQQLHIVDLLDKEIQELQAKPERTAEESDRLRKLMLEWQFQKRLQESKQSDEDEEEEDDEDMDTMIIMQRLEAEKRARQQTAVPAISVLDLLQDEERRRKQQLEEIRKREAEERAKQEEERRWREEERVKREADEKRRQEEEYYNRLEAERRRQHEEAERRLLTPDEPAGLYRPPLPREYQPPVPHNPTNTPPPPPQRNTSYLKSHIASPDTLYTAKFVSYAGDEEDEEEGKEAARTWSGSSQSGQVKLSATQKSYGDLPATVSTGHSKPQPPPTARKPRPLSDGIFLSGSFQPPVNNSNSTGPPLPAKPGSVPPGGLKDFNSYTGTTAGLVGSDVFREPRDKWMKSQEQENSNPSGAPESLTFKERQRLFSQGKEVSNKVKASRKLMELENELNTKQ
ncbi:LOW QUALITY PROTEIN: afadin [Thalassophryne amazonica]|uniref:LOW QUALITY PROTEIN: afadin n=1 Tax=Thalassophryne amazonica TaxID=390379 RepID=UPI00147117DF|nr:LOW QUALITY PROTEIN: afadin [Thalassophryne amazonica]